MPTCRPTIITTGGQTSQHQGHRHSPVSACLDLVVRPCRDSSPWTSRVQSSPRQKPPAGSSVDGRSCRFCLYRHKLSIQSIQKKYIYIYIYIYLCICVCVCICICIYRYYMLQHATASVGLVGSSYRTILYYIFHEPRKTSTSCSKPSAPSTS